MLKIVLVSGKAGVGKTTFSNYLKDSLIKRKVQANIISFATGIKDIAKDLGWDGKKDFKGRKFLQDLGKVAREYDINVWVDDSLNRVVGGVSIVDDWRFPNELERCREFADVVTVRIVAPHRETLKGTPSYEDISENSLHNNGFYDIIIYNTEDVTLKDLQYVVDVISEKITHGE